MKTKSNQNFSGLIHDGFFDDPKAVRRSIAKLDFIPPRSDGVGGVAWYCKVPTPQEIVSKLESIWGFAIEPVYSEFRYSFKNADASRNEHGAPVICHMDYFISHYTSVIYLTKPQYCNGGTNFYMHKPSEKIEFIPKVTKVDFRDAKQWKCYFSSDMAFNRMVTYKSSLFHSVKPPFFGSTLNDARIILTTRFNRVKKTTRL